MRQRKVKNRDEICAACAGWIADDPRALKGRWRRLFDNPQQPLHVEIGSGKGRFICEMARLHPDVNFIAVEGAPKINVRILQKAAELDLKNLVVLMEFIGDARDYFAEGELDRIYLNFSDPWPKKRNIKRRLTHRDKLAAYEACSAPGSLLQLKTDNDMLFAFSLDEIRSRGLLIRWVTRDLHHSPYAARNVLTEYEEKFSGAGKSINCLQAVLKQERA
jgi:tRNA (guanine-N7-)-methyltransferase